MLSKVNKKEDVLGATTLVICKMISGVLLRTRNALQFRKCHKVGHFAKCGNTEETKSPQKKRFTKPKNIKELLNK